MTGDGRPFRLLVTASRSLRDYGAVRSALGEAARDAAGREVIVVHGAGGYGDALADAAARELGFTVEAHPADWDAPCRAECDHGHRGRRPYDRTTYCPAAGIYRNDEMVKAGADLVLCFLMPCEGRSCRRPRPHDSHGAGDCAERARKAGTPVQVIRP